jgi:dihydrodipicolinate synthase/N-acetylneuraminate lyase
MEKERQMTEKTMRGVYPILVTPFDEQSRVDVDSLQNVVDYCLEAGVHGLGVALGSEVLALSEAERVLVTQTIVERVQGRVPVVVNTGGPVVELALLYSRLAKEHGADALMLRPPTFQPAGPDQVVAYFKAVSDEVGLPIYIQDTPVTPVPASLARRLAEECEHVRYFKVERHPPSHMVDQAVKEAGDVLTVFGGAGGHYLIEELRRGAQGTMPGCCQAEAFVRVWDAYHRGDEDEAWEAFQPLLEVGRVVQQEPGAFYKVHKEILRQRGLIRTAKIRGPVAPLDELTQRELQALIEKWYG